MNDSMCSCVQRHVPLPLTYKQIRRRDGETVVLCPTTYDNVRGLLTGYQMFDGIPPGSTTKHYSRYVRELCLDLWRDDQSLNSIL